MIRAAGLDTLCALLAAPLSGDPSVWPWIESGEWAAEVEAALGAPVHPALHSPTGMGEAYAVSFGAPGALLCPIESAHKPWTSLPGAGVPFAHERGWLGGDPAAHMLALYEGAGISVPPELLGMPDHLALELEYLGLLAGFGSDSDVALFQRQHLDWVADLAAKSRRVGAPVFYQKLLELIGQVAT